MKKLEHYYDNRVSGLGERGFLKHFGHTERGLPISRQQFERMVSQLEASLNPANEDQLLDLCCSNGIITHIIGRKCKQVVGVNLSKNMVNIARKYHKAPHISYYKEDILTLDKLDALKVRKSSKILMHGGLQHFTQADFGQLLETIMSFAAEECTLLFTFVPERGCQREFHNTIRKRIIAAYYKITNRDIFGHWWERDFIASVCAQYGLRC